MLEPLLASLEQLLRLTLEVRGERPPSTRGFRIGTPTLEWKGNAVAVLASPTLQQAKRATLTAAAEVAGLDEFLAAAGVGDFERDLLPGIVAQGFLNAATASGDPVRPAVRSFEDSFRTREADAVVEVFLSNCQLQVVDERVGPERMFNPMSPLPIELSRARIRPATREDLSELVDIFRMPAPVAPNFSLSHSLGVSAVLEMPFRYPLPHVLTRAATDDLYILLDVLRLSANSAVKEVATRWRPLQFPFQGGGAYWEHFGIVDSGEDLSSTNLMRQTAHLAALEERHRIALRRFSLALERDDPSDRLVDLWIGLEALFASGAQQIRVACSRGAAAWLNDPTIETELSKSYRIRSAIVHGAPHSRQEVLDVADHASSVLRRCLLKLLDSPAALREQRGR